MEIWRRRRLKKRRRQKWNFLSRRHNYLLQRQIFIVLHYFLNFFTRLMITFYYALSIELRKVEEMAHAIKEILMLALYNNYCYDASSYLMTPRAIFITSNLIMIFMCLDPFTATSCLPALFKFQFFPPPQKSCRIK